MWLFCRLPEGVAGSPGVVNPNSPGGHGGHPSGIPESGMDDKSLQGYCQVSWLSAPCKVIIMFICFVSVNHYLCREQYLSTNYLSCI